MDKWTKQIKDELDSKPRRDSASKLELKEKIKIESFDLLDSSSKRMKKTGIK